MKAPNTVKPIPFDETALAILKKRYLHEGETPEDRFWTIAYAVAEAERKFGATDEKIVGLAHEFYELFERKVFFPNSPTIFNAGRENAQLSACFVLPLEDSMDSIFSTLKSMSKVHKSGGGTGFDFSTLRPKGSPISTSGGKASGPVSFMKVFDAATSAINQGGMRRGANMGMLRVDHPDIEEFIACKDEEGALTNFNISVAVTNEFMERLMDAQLEHEPWDLVFDGKVMKTVDLRDLWKKICCQAWKNGEPGIVFIDKINEANEAQGLGTFGTITATNPCFTGDTRVAIKNKKGIIEFITIKNLEDWSENIRAMTFDTHILPTMYNESGNELDGITDEHATVIKKGTKKVITLHLSNGSTITCTPDHRIAVAPPTRKPFHSFIDVEYIRADESINCRLLRNISEEAYLEDVHVEYITFPEEKEEVYDLIVQYSHCFYILPHGSPARIENCVLVHNCGEQPLLPNEACNLGSINLANITNDHDLKRVVKLAVRFLDNVIEINHYPTPEIAEQCLKTRKIGLGVMGLADKLHQMSLPYDSPSGREMARKWMRLIKRTARLESVLLGAKRGATIDGRRNATLTTVAPTGTISMIAGCSSGIEPVFSLFFTKTVLDGTPFQFINQNLMDYCERKGIDVEKVKRHIAAHGSIADMESIPKDMREIFKTASGISYEDHINMQAKLQGMVDAAISKTINMPNSATVEDVHRAYMQAYSLDCKGLTIYRDRSRSLQVLMAGTEGKDSKDSKDSKEEELKEKTVQTIYTRTRPKVTSGTTEEFRTGCGSLYITANCDEPGLYEVFCETGKASGCKAQSEAMGRLVSYVMRNSTDEEEIKRKASEMAHVLKGIRCSSCIRSGAEVTSCPSAISKVLEQWTQAQGASIKKDKEEPEEEEKPDDKKREEEKEVVRCPDCGNALVFQEGCRSCPECGYSKCS